MALIQLLQSMLAQELIETQNSNNNYHENELNNKVSTSAVIDILHGGTGAATAAQALANLGALQKVLSTGKLELPNVIFKASNYSGTGLIAGLDEYMILHVAFDLGQAATQITVNVGTMASGFVYTNIKSVGALVLSTNSAGTVAIIGGRDAFIKQYIIAIHQVDGWTTT